MSLIFVSTCHKEYGKAFIFPTLSRLTCRTVALLEPDDKRELPANVERLPYVSSRFYQHGTFLDALPCHSDDVVVLADADAVVQRDWSESERAMLDTLGDRLAVGFNMYPQQTGAEELDILRLTVPLEVAARALRLTPEDMTACPMYNWGLVAARVSTWRRLQDYYQAMTLGFDPQTLFVHPTWMQYVLCCALHKHGMPVVELGYQTHSHGHFTLTADHNVWKGKLRYKDEDVFLAHLVRGVCF